MKLDLEIVEGIVKKNVSDNKELVKILKDLEQAEKEAKELRENNRAEKGKRKLVAVQLEDTESVYIVQAKEEFEETTLVDILRTKIAVDFNGSKKGSKHPVTKLSELFEFVAQKFWRDYDLANKTKTPIDIIKSPNLKIATK